MAKHNLVIVESPAKAKTIGKYLGKDYEVKACMGHLRDLQKSNLSVDVDNDFEPVYKPIKGKEAIISDLKKSAKAADTVYLATDPDREGEAISWHLKSLLDLPDKKTKRVTFNEITKNVVRQSIENPRDIDQNLVDAQQARRILDRLVGYQLSHANFKAALQGISSWVTLVLRLLVLPLTSLGICLALNVSHDLTLVLLIAASAPPAALLSMFAARFGKDTALTSSLVSVQTAISALTMPVLVGLAEVLG